jgi:hypothetical protein
LRFIKITEFVRCSEAAPRSLQYIHLLGGAGLEKACTALRAGNPASAGVMVSSIQFEYPIYLSSISSQRVFSAEL